MAQHPLSNQRDATYVLLILLELPSEERVYELTRSLQDVIDTVVREWDKTASPSPESLRCRGVILAEEQLEDPYSDLMGRMSPEPMGLDVEEAPIMRLQVAKDLDGVDWHALVQVHHRARYHGPLEPLVAAVTACIQDIAERCVGGSQIDAVLEDAEENNTEPRALPYRNHVAMELATAARIPPFRELCRFRPPGFRVLMAQEWANFTVPFAVGMRDPRVEDGSSSEAVIYYSLKTS